MSEIRSDAPSKTNPTGPAQPLTPLERELLAALKGLLATTSAAIDGGDWVVDGAADPEADLYRALTVIAKAEEPTSEAKP